MEIGVSNILKDVGFGMSLMNFFKAVVDNCVESVERKTGQELRRLDRWEDKNGGSSEKSEEYREKLNNTLDKIDSYKADKEDK